MLATHQRSDTAAGSAPSRRAGHQVAYAQKWPCGDAKGSNQIFIEIPLISTPKHRFRRPEDRLH